MASRIEVSAARWRKPEPPDSGEEKLRCHPAVYTVAAGGVLAPISPRSRQLLLALLRSDEPVQLLDGFVLFDGWTRKSIRDPVNTFQQAVTKLSKTLSQLPGVAYEILSGDKDAGYWWQLKTASDSNVAEAARWLMRVTNALGGSDVEGAQVSLWNGVAGHLQLLDPFCLGEGVLLAGFPPRSEAVSGASCREIRSTLRAHGLALGGAILQVAQRVFEGPSRLTWGLVREFLRRWHFELACCAEASRFLGGKPTLPPKRHSRTDIEYFANRANAYLAHIRHGRDRSDETPRIPAGFRKTDGSVEAYSTRLPSGSGDSTEAFELEVQDLKTHITETAFFRHLIEDVRTQMTSVPITSIETDVFESLLGEELSDWIAWRRRPLIACPGLPTLVSSAMYGAVLWRLGFDQPSSDLDAMPDPNRLGRSVAALVAGVPQPGDAERIDISISKLRSLGHPSRTTPARIEPGGSLNSIHSNKSPLPLHILEPAARTLGRGSATTATWFRSSGPLACDFAGEAILPRADVVNALLTHLKHAHLVVLEGPPATGKTVIVRHLAYSQLLNGRKDVFWFSAGLQPEYDASALADEMSTRPGLFCCDDMHLDSRRLILLLSKLRLCPNSRVLITSRRPLALELTHAGWEKPAVAEMPIPAFHGVADVLRNYWTSRQLRAPESAIAEVAATVGQNLWLLAYAAKGAAASRFQGASLSWLKTGVSDELVLRDSLMPGSCEGLLALSVLYQFGIWTAESFLTAHCGLSTEVLRHLFERGDIRRRDSGGAFVYALHHTEIARAYCSYASPFLDRLASRCPSATSPAAFLRAYADASAPNAVEAIVEIALSSPDVASTVVRHLIDCGTISELLAQRCRGPRGLNEFFETLISFDRTLAVSAIQTAWSPTLAARLCAEAHWSEILAFLSTVAVVDQRLAETMCASLPRDAIRSGREMVDLWRHTMGPGRRYGSRVARTAEVLGTPLVENPP